MIKTTSGLTAGRTSAASGADDGCGLCGFWRCHCTGSVLLAATAAAPTDSDPDMDEALRRARQCTAGGGARPRILRPSTRRSRTAPRCSKCPLCPGSGESGGACSTCGTLIARHGR